MIQSTVRTLLAYDDELKRMTSSILFHFMRSKITEFYANNGLRIDTHLKKLQDLQTEYLIMENGRPKNENGKPVFIEGKSREELDKRIKEILDVEVPIKI